MSAASVLGWLLAWTTLGSAVLLLTAWVVRSTPIASVRHVAWFIALACVPVILLFGPDSGFPKNKAAVQTQQCPEAIADANETEGPCHSAGTGFISQRVIPLALCGWVLGTTWTLGRMLLALRTVHRWRRQSAECPLPGGLPLNSFRKVDIRIAREDVPVVPITFGFRRPVVLLPRSAQLWDESRIAAILWHELGHVRRFDNLSQLLGLLVCALHWWNPVFWFAARRLEAEAEMAADDFALRRGLRASSYAAELLAVAAELRPSPWKIPMAHTAMVKAFTLEERLRAIIDPKCRRGVARLIDYGRVSGAFAGMAIVLILVAPRITSWLEPRAAAAPDCLAPETAKL